MQSQIDQWDNSLVLRIPADIIQALHLQRYDAVDCSIENGKLIIQPIASLPALSLDELLAEMSDLPEPEVNWGLPMGEEVW